MKMLIGKIELFSGRYHLYTKTERRCITRDIPVHVGTNFLRDKNRLVNTNNYVVFQVLSTESDFGLERL